MITDKIFCKLTVFFLIIALLSPALLSCNENQEDPPFELLEDSSEKDPYSLYRIVVSVNASPELLRAAQELKERLTAQTGVPCELAFDSEAEAKAKTVFEIVLGNTSRSVSQKSMREFRKNDYLCQLQEGKLVLGGRSDTATLSALRRFYDELLLHASATSILPNEAGFVHYAEYSTNPITIGGSNLSCFHIVYSNTSSEHVIFLAKTLQTKIAEEASYSLSVQSEADFDGISKRMTLTLSEEETEGVAHLRFDEQGVVLSAKDLFGLSSAVKEFFQQMLASAEENGSFGMPNTFQAINYERLETTVASILIDPDKDPITEITSMSDLVQTNLPDLVFLRNIPEEQRTYLYEMVDHQYHITSNIEISKKESACRLLENISATANLYQAGNSTEGFLILSTSQPPTEEILAHLNGRTLPLLIIVFSPSDGTWTSNAFDRVIFSTVEQTSFAIWAEPHCFLVNETLSHNGYRTFAVERASAFYL